jgi:hypothetical protein
MKQVRPAACYSGEPKATRNRAVRQKRTKAGFVTSLDVKADMACRILVWAGIRWLEHGAAVIKWRCVHVTN